MKNSQLLKYKEPMSLKRKKNIVEYSGSASLFSGQYFYTACMHVQLSMASHSDLSRP
jgi:hypothetical protein